MSEGTKADGNPDILLLIGRMDGKLDLLLTRHSGEYYAGNGIGNIALP